MTPHSNFSLVASEAGIASDQLAHGVALLDRVRLNEPATLAQAFFPLTVGFERSAKLAYALDHRLNTRKFPTDKDFRTLGHRLDALLAHLERGIISRRWPKSEEMRRPGMPVHAAVVDCLASFAASDGRYYNLASLGGRSDLVNPVETWIEKVVLPTYRNAEPDGVDGRAFLSSSNDAERLLTEFNVRAATTPLIRLYTLQLIRWIARAIMQLHDQQRANLPSIEDFFGRFERTDKYFITHKTYPSRS